MDNKKTGKFIAQCRKENNLSQRQLAERLNVTDKAVSKWETGNGAPDISLLTKLADELGVTVVELLDGEYAKGTNEKEQTEKIVVEALLNAKKERAKTAISIFVSVVILFSLVNVVIYGYWGRRHKILYNVDSVYVFQQKDNPNIYDFYYNCTVKNWWFDFNEYTYKLVDALGGEPGIWHFEAETEFFTSDNTNETVFVIHVEFDISSVYEPIPTIEEIVKTARFDAYDESGEQDPDSSLFIEDYKDIKVVMI